LNCFTRSMAGMLRSKATMFSQKPRFAILDQVWNFLDLSDCR